MLVCFNLSLLTVFNFDIFLNCNCVLSDVYRQPVFIFSLQPSVCGNLTNSDFGHQYLDVVAVTRYSPYSHLAYCQLVVSSHIVHRILKSHLLLVILDTTYTYYKLCIRRGNLISQYQFPCLTCVIITNNKQSNLLFYLIFIYILSHSSVRYCCNHRILST